MKAYSQTKCQTAPMRNGGANEQHSKIITTFHSELCFARGETYCPNMKLPILLLLSIVSSIPQSWASIIVPIGKWDKSELRVCFASPGQKRMSRFFTESKFWPSRPKLQNASKLEKQTVQKALEREFTTEKTGITFLGFKDCEKDSADVFVYFGRSGERGPVAAAKIGQDLVVDFWEEYVDQEDGLTSYVSLNERRPGQRPSYVYIEKFENYLARVNGKVAVTESEYLELATLHEFGHTAGLAHEDTRFEMNSNSFCGVSNVSRDRQKNGNEEYASSYDPYSIMSYCFVNSIRDNLGVHFGVVRSGLAVGHFTAVGFPLMPYFSASAYITDQNILVTRTQRSEFTEFHIRIGLSEKDRLALKTLYE